MNPQDHDRINGIIAFAEAVMVLRDPYEDGHDQRTEKLALKLAGKLNLSSLEFIENLRYGARLHDVGKIMIAESALNKIKLTPSEKNMVNSHALLGAEAIKALGFNKDIVDIIHHHHENWDGSGYPDKLKGNEISLGARIVRIADSYDAIQNGRAYHKAKSKRDTLIELEKENGISFDPVIFEAFKGIIYG